MTPKHRAEQKTAESRRERKFALRAEGAEEAFETFRQALRAFTDSEKDAAEAIQGFDELIALAKAIGGESERRRERLYKATITYGANKMVELGPTVGRDHAASLVRSWMDAHAGVTSKGEAVKSATIDEVGPNGDEDEETHREEA